MTKQCNNCKHWRLGTASLDDNYCNLTGEQVLMIIIVI